MAPRLARAGTTPVFSTLKSLSLNQVTNELQTFNGTSYTPVITPLFRILRGS